MNTKFIREKYKIMSRNNCERYCKQHHSKASIIVSIKSSWDRVNPDLPMNDKNNVKHILSLSFDDVEYGDAPDFCMKWEDGEKVAVFINEHYDEAETIIVHCDGGISRSAGVAAAIMRVKEGNDSVVFANNSKNPNRTCFLRTLRGFGYI